MLLSGVHLLPHGLLPLNIFEPRYQQMLDHALKTDRMLAIGTLENGWDDESDSAIHPWSTLAIVRASVAQPDSTSQVILQGLLRIHFESWLQYEPFRIAGISPVPSRDGDTPHALKLASDLLAAADNMLPENDEGLKIKRALHSFTDPLQIADFIAANFLPATDDRIALIGLTSVEDRLRLTLDSLLKS